MSESAFELVRRHKSRETTATETVCAALDRLEELYDRIGAVAAIDRERSLVEAARADPPTLRSQSPDLPGLIATVATAGPLHQPDLSHRRTRQTRRTPARPRPLGCGG
ncbi:hypothetical protein ACIBI7_39520 [Nonomuraea fuscirosea]|uniref:hypothetical protein n=1 Tax=Nonomuraea fuscirosea TaxID=1291556 RepID=UPI00379C62A9